VSEGHKNIHGPRRDLSRIDGDPTTFVTTRVFGHNIESLAGLETMTSLTSLEIRDMESPDLSVVAALPRLTVLVLERITGEVDYSPLERATNLRQLMVAPEYPEHALSLAQVNFGRLRLLRDLKFGWRLLRAQGRS